MDADVLISAVDPTLPAEISPKSVNGLLRNQLCYDGVIITDELSMQAISTSWTVSQATTLAIMAGFIKKVEQWYKSK
jgi:beta-N-acetylhexosaminidase